MNKKVLDFVNKLEGYKTAIKQLHWDAKNMSQHELCDDIADSIAEFQDTVSEVEQSITGKLKVNSLKPTEYKIKDLKSFVEDVLDAANSFYKEVKDMGDTYVGMASDCESFLSDMQRKLYLVNFTLKEELKERLRGKINESMPKNLANHDEVDKFMGRRPKTMKARINQIYRIVKRYGIDSKLYHDDHWQAKDDYYRAITSLGCEFEMRPCGNSNNLDNWDDITSDGGYCDYAEDGMPRSKQYAVKIMYDDGMNIGGYIKFMAAGRVDDPFSAYDTCMILWPKNNRVLENREMRNESINEYGDKPETREKMGAIAKRGIMKGDVKPYQNAMGSLGRRGSSKDDYVDFQKGFENENRQIKLSEAELKQVVKEAAMNVIKEGFWDELSPEKKDFLRRGGGSNGEFATPDISSLTPEERAFLDGGINILSKQMRLATIRDARKAGMSIRDYINSGRGNVTEGINETPLNYDVDNFSGRWTKSEPSDEEWALADSRANGDYLDDPFHAPNSWDDDEWVDGDKDMENDYSWGLYHRMNNVGKSPIDRQHDVMDAAQNRRDHAAYWTDKDNERGRKLMDKWINGKRDTDELGDVDFSYNPYKYNESKKPMKVTENELKQIVKEAATKLIKEYGENVTNYVRRNGCAARRKTGDPRKDRENREKWFERQREKQRKQLEKVSKGTDESIEIKPENKGKFTATKKATGKSTEELTHSKNPLTRKRAIFAQNAKKWAKK